MWESHLSQFDNKKEAAEEISLCDSFYSLTHMDTDIDAEVDM